MIGYPVTYRTDIASEGQGIVTAFDPATETVTVLDDDDGTTWTGTLEHIEQPTDVWFFDTARGYAYSQAVRNAAGEWVAGDKTLAQWQQERPGMILLTGEAVDRHHDDAAREAPKLITAEEYDDALNCLPPMGWHRGGSAESFKMSELTSGNMTAIYVRLSREFVRLVDDYRLTHPQIMARIYPVIEQLRAERDAAAKATERAQEALGRQALQ